MKPKKRRKLPGTFLTRDLGEGAWRLSRGEAEPIDVINYLGGKTPDRRVSKACLDFINAAPRALASRTLVSVRLSEMPLTVVASPPACTAASTWAPAAARLFSVAVSDSLTP